MELYLIISVILATAFAMSSDDIILKEFELYKAEFNKTYTSPVENKQRLEVFKKTKLLIAEHNLKYTKGEVTYSMALNKFADWLPEEFDKMNCYSVANSNITNSTHYIQKSKSISQNDLPDSFNWVEKGAVTSVKDQKGCGCGYAFSALAALEAYHYFETYKLISLSVQQVLDCSIWVTHGCRGGNPMFVYNYLIEAGGSISDEAYPYEGVEGKCRFNPDKIEARLMGYFVIFSDERDLKEAVATIGPVSVAMYAPQSLRSYKHGIYQDPRCLQKLEPNHAALVVGYGTDKETGEDYWLLKNSWGSQWGENGYFRLPRHKNMCNILFDPVYPLV